MTKNFYEVYSEERDGSEDSVVETLIDQPTSSFQPKATFDQKISESVNNATESWRKQKQDLADQLEKNQ